MHPSTLPDSLSLPTMPETLSEPETLPVTVRFLIFPETTEKRESKVFVFDVAPTTVTSMVYPLPSNVPENGALSEASITAFPLAETAMLAISL